MAFPTTSLLDDFNRADQDPIAGNWSGPWFPGIGQGRLLTNQFVSQDGVNIGGSAWIASTFGADTEAYAKVSLISTRMDIALRLANLNSASITGYLMLSSATSVIVYRLDSSSSINQLGATISQVISTGDSLGLSAIGSTLEVWYKSGAGAWTSLGTRTDATYGSAGYIALGCTTGSMDDFGGGTVVAAGTIQDDYAMDGAPFLEGVQHNVPY